MIVPPVCDTELKSAVTAAVVGDAPILATHTDRLCVVLSAIAPTTLLYEMPCPDTEVGSSGLLANELQTKTTDSEFAAGVYVESVAIDDEPDVE
jgi:hypothetical protein